MKLLRSLNPFSFDSEVSLESVEFVRDFAMRSGSRVCLDFWFWGLLMSTMISLLSSSATRFKGVGLDD